MVSLIHAIKFKVWLFQTSIHSLSLPTQRRHTTYRHLGRQNAPIHNYKLFCMLKYVLTCDDVFIFIKWQNKKNKYVAQLVKNPPAMQKTWFDSWVGMIGWRREQQPTAVFLSRESHGQRSLAGYSPWGHKESDTTEQLSVHTHLACCIWVEISFYPKVLIRKTSKQFY